MIVDKLILDIIMGRWVLSIQEAGSGWVKRIQKPESLEAIMLGGGAAGKSHFGNLPGFKASKPPGFQAAWPPGNPSGTLIAAQLNYLALKNKISIVCAA